MDCSLFRKQIDGAPTEQFDGRDAHALSCAECAVYASDAVSMDQRIHAALSVDVPGLGMPWDVNPDSVSVTDDTTVTDLAEARQARRAATTRSWMSGTRFGLAASVMVAATMVVALWPGPRSGLLADDIFDHLHHEPESLVRTAVAAPSDVVSRVMRPVASGIDPRVGVVSYARTCRFRGRQVPHLVVQGIEGPVMLLFLEDEYVDAPMPLDEEGYRGVVVPVDGGSIAIVGSEQEPIHRIRKLMADTVKWRI
jgi:hypothetical protein